jgi:hypothetical protein
MRGGQAAIEVNKTHAAKFAKGHHTANRTQQARQRGDSNHRYNCKTSKLTWAERPVPQSSTKSASHAAGLAQDSACLMGPKRAKR